MKKTISAGCLAAAMVVGAPAATAFAGNSKHTTPGVPETSNCAGQTLAYLAQGNGMTGETGLGHVAAAMGLSVKEGMALVRGYCAGE